MAIQWLRNLPERLERQADNVEADGWCSAARLMREAAIELVVRRAQEPKEEDADTRI